VRRCNSLAPGSEIFPAPKNEIRKLPGLVARLVGGFLSRTLPKDEIGELPLGPVALWVAGVLLVVAIVWIVIFAVVLCWRVSSS
jgi:hypothetical protein